MGRPGRYTLSVMAWVAAYAGWSSIIGLVVAALTGEEAREVSSAWSALLTVVGPLVPTLVALWFNDWARDGFPTREQVRARRRAAFATPALVVGGAPDAPVASEAPTPPPVAAPVAPPAPARPPGPMVARATVAEATIADATIVTAHPLGVPTALAAAAGGSTEGFPVAPLVRD